MGLFVHLGTFIKIDEKDDTNEVMSQNKVMFVYRLLVKQNSLVVSSQLLWKIRETLGVYPRILLSLYIIIILLIVRIMLHNMNLNRAKSQNKSQNDDNGYMELNTILLLLFSCLMKAFQYMFSGVVISLQFHNKVGHWRMKERVLARVVLYIRFIVTSWILGVGPMWLFL